MTTNQLASLIPFSFKLAKWYGYLFSAVFLLYGVVSIVLGFLDKSYDNLGTPIFFLVVGLILVGLAMAYRDLKRWGWYGQVVTHIVIMVFAAIGYGHFESIVLLVMSAIVLLALFSPNTKNCFSFGR
ncbi:MAG: hypothetical protein ACE5FH_02850 [Candidatus Zixiibacteriota bacterium]